MIVGVRLTRWLRRRWKLVAGVTLVLGVVGVLILRWYVSPDWGAPTVRVSSPNGGYEVVQYEFTAVIDPGWNLAIEQVDGDDREWFWRSVEGPAPQSIRFTGDTSIEVVDQEGNHYGVDFNPATLEPSERYCLRTEYCYEDPWDGYTRDSPVGGWPSAR